ncbi:YueI family protein [Anoxybacter fermentans]
MVERKSNLEKTVEYGLYGTPELKKEERLRYLGEFRERVLKALTVEQVEEPGVYPEILDALCDPRASKLILRRDIDLERARDYLELAKKKKVAFKRVDSPKFKGDIGLVVVSSNAVDESHILVEDRKERLRALGLSEDLINAVGKKLCLKCWNKIETLYPKELINYRRITWLESLTGTRCAVCSRKK